jgi:hypothetical protein
MMLRRICVAHSAGKLGCLPRKRSRARQCLRPGDELDPDEERSIRLNARTFQKILIRGALTKAQPRATERGGTRFPKAAELYRR